jgi:hypothetical protein
MSDDTSPADAPAARCGTGTIDGAVWRPGDPVKHLGPPYRIAERQSAAYYDSQLFQTRCGLRARYGDGRLIGWRRQGPGENDDVWCPACLDQAFISYELWPDEGLAQER